MSGRHKLRVEQRAPFCWPEGAERQGEGGRPARSTTIMLGDVYQTSQTKHQSGAVNREHRVCGPKESLGATCQNPWSHSGFSRVQPAICLLVFTKVNLSEFSTLTSSLFPHKPS
ncbi:hypothetical protein GOODEAATRI_014832 [Goodea atripinnis]|uniref:Uncharacterized protein n=1 Tax=Goodea atripinnis TaxID=208336 RepID=A0ABV0N1G9_9TELE